MDQIWANFWYGFRWGTGKLNSSPKEPPSAIVGSQGGTSMAPHFTIFQNIKVNCNHRQVFLPTVKRQLLNEVNMFLLGHLQIWAHQHTRASPQKSVNCAQLVSLKSDFLWLSCPIWLPGSWWASTWQDKKVGTLFPQKCDIEPPNYDPSGLSLWYLRAICISTYLPLFLI